MRKHGLRTTLILILLTTLCLSTSGQAVEEDDVSPAPTTSSASPASGNLPRPTPDGTAIPDGWHDEAGRRYYYQNGQVQKGFMDDADGCRYYLSPTDGHMMAGGWLSVNNERYYLSDSGEVFTGMHYVDGNMVLLDEETGAASANEDVTLLGVQYHVDSSGIIEDYVTDAGRQATAVLDEIGWDLYAAYEYAASTAYAMKEMRAPAGSVDTEYYASYGFERHVGNCYVINAMLYQMAKMLGYEVYFIEGGVWNSAGYVEDHGWCEIVEDGEIYVYDAQFNIETGKNGYRRPYGEEGTWKYCTTSGQVILTSAR